MEIRFVQEYFMKVTPEWYAPEILSGEGTLEEQVCEYERQRAEKDGLYVVDLKRGNVAVSVVIQSEPCTHCHSEICTGECPESEESSSSVQEQKDGESSEDSVLGEEDSTS